MFFILYLMMSVGILMAGFCSFLPPSLYAQVPPIFRILFVIIGFMIANIGYIMLRTRANKTGAQYLIIPPKQGEHLWFYAYRDGTILITPGIREVESQLYSPELDAQIQEFRSYRIFDHSVRFVPEGIGHAIDLDMCLYTKLLKNSYGFEKLKEAREAASILEQLNPMAGQKDINPTEGVITKGVMKQAYKLAKRGARR